MKGQEKSTPMWDAYELDELLARMQLRVDSTIAAFRRLTEAARYLAPAAHAFREQAKRMQGAPEILEE